MRKILIVLSFLLCFSVFTDAQQPPDSIFLEVLDSAGNPVKKAEVQTVKNDFNSNNSLLTDEKGTVGFIISRASNYYNDLISYFTVVKDGYYPYHHLGGPDSYFTYGTKARIELFKIPLTEEEKRRLGDEQLKREFLWAAKTGDAAALKKLLKKGLNPNLTTSELRGTFGRKGISAIQLAALSANAETVKELIKAGAPVQDQKEPLRNILLLYLRADPFFWRKPKDEKERREILRRYEDGVATLLKAGADFKAKDEYSGIAILTAAERGYPRAVKYLLDKGFSPNFMDERGVTLLMAAAGDGYPPIRTSKVETVELLLKLGADPNLSKNGCGSALSAAAERGDIAAMQALLNKGAKVNLNCPDVQAPLLWAVDRSQVEAAKLLIEAGADIKATGHEGNNALMLAAYGGNAEMTRMLLDKGLPVNAQRADGLSALLVALTSFSSPNMEVLKILLQAGADSNIKVDKGNDFCLIPVKTAAEPYRLAVLKLLVENGANVNLSCGNGETALSYGVSQHNPEVIKLLLELGANPNGERIDKALNLIKTYYKEGDYYRKAVDETVKLVEEARAKEKNPNH